MNKQLLFLSVFIFLCSISFGQSYRIYTFAGGSIGDGDPATDVSILPNAIAVDGSGNVYITDADSNRVRKINSSGIISTVAGNGSIGYSGDGGLATSAQLNWPCGVTIDVTGNIYIADRYNNCIRKVNTSGIITTIAGNGMAGFSGDGGLATTAELHQPYGVAVDGSGNIYIADWYNNRVREINTSGVITTIAGNGIGGYSGDGGTATSAELCEPKNVVLDRFGNVYILDECNSRVRKISTSGIITTYAGNGNSGYTGDGGPATSAELNYSQGICIDTSRNVYIADYNNNRIRKVNTSGIITTIAGNGVVGCKGDGGAATSAEVVPTGVAIDVSGDVYIADGTNYNVRRINVSGIISTIAGNGKLNYSGDGGAANLAALYGPYGITEDKLGNIYIADKTSNHVRKVSKAGIITTIAGNGVFGYSGDGGPADSAELKAPCAVAVDNSGNVYVVDYGNNCVRKINTSGVITTVAGNGIAGYSGDGGLGTSAELDLPNAVAVDISGNLYIADAYNNRIRKVNSSGVITTVVGTGTPGYSGDGWFATSAKINFPQGVVVDASGNNMYISDGGNNRIRKINAGIISTIAGSTSGFSGDGGPADSAKLSGPWGIALDDSGCVYFSDAGNDRVRKINKLGIITTIAGKGKWGFYGDGGLADSAKISVPDEIAVDPSGTVYIADGGNNRVRMLTLEPLGINEILETQNFIHVYPNPSNGKFTFQSSVFSRQLTVEVYNVLGEKVASLNPSDRGTLNSLPSGGQGWAIDLSAQPSGIYFYRVLSDGKFVGSGRLVKE